MSSDLQNDCSNCSGIHIDKYILPALGIVQKQTFLKIKENYLYCVPYSLSCNSSKLIVSLSPEEQIFFKQYENDLHKLHITIEDPKTLEIVSIYINTKMHLLGNMVQGNNYCFIDLFFKSVPESLTNLLKIFCLKEKSHKELYNQDKIENILILSKYMDNIHLDNHVSFRLNDKKKFQAKIIKISYSKIIIFVDLPSLILSNDTKLSLEFNKQDISFFVSGQIVNIEESHEVEGFLFLTIELDYSFSLADSLLPLYTSYNKILKNDQSG